MKRKAIVFPLFEAIFVALLFSSLIAETGDVVFYNFHQEGPGQVHKITVSDLPKPFASKAAVNPPELSRKPADAVPHSLAGFKVSLYAGGFDEPRELRVAPNGDVFLAESSKGEIKVLHGISSAGK